MLIRMIYAKIVFDTLSSKLVFHLISFIQIKNSFEMFDKQFMLNRTAFRM